MDVIAVSGRDFDMAGLVKAVIGLCVYLAFELVKSSAGEWPSCGCGFGLDCIFNASGRYSCGDSCGCSDNWEDLMP